MWDGVIGERAVDGVQVSRAKGGTVHGVVGVSRAAGAVGHLAEATVNGSVSKADIGGGILGTCISDPGGLAVGMVGVGFDLSLRIGGGGKATGEIVGVVLLLAVRVGLAQEAAADPAS